MADLDYKRLTQFMGMTFSVGDGEAGAEPYRRTLEVELFCVMVYRDKFK